jgi:hypothetical protein
MIQRNNHMPWTAAILAANNNYKQLQPINHVNLFSPFIFIGAKRFANANTF